MANIRSAFLCNAASQETSGLVSVLGAFIDTVSNATFPLPHLFWLVGRIELERGEEHGSELAVQVERLSDGAMLVNARGTLIAERDPTADPDAPGIGQLVMPVPIVFDQPGAHEVRILVNDVQLWSAPLRAVLLDGP